MFDHGHGVLCHALRFLELASIVVLVKLPIVIMFQSFLFGDMHTDFIKEWDVDFEFECAFDRYI